MIKRIWPSVWVRVDIYGDTTRVEGPEDETPDKFPRDDRERCSACWLNHPHSQAHHQARVEYFVQQTARDKARWAMSEGTAEDSRPAVLREFN